MVDKGDVLRAPPTEQDALSSANPQVVKVPTTTISIRQRFIWLLSNGEVKHIATHLNRPDLCGP